MTTKLDGTLKREITINGHDYTLSISPQGMTLALKGKRKGFDLEWSALVNGDAALASALNASLTAPLGESTAQSPRRNAPNKAKH